MQEARKKNKEGQECADHRRRAGEAIGQGKGSQDQGESVEGAQQADEYEAQTYQRLGHCFVRTSLIKFLAISYQVIEVLLLM